MRRVLVLTHEAARHPFRQRLPRHLFEQDGSGEPPRRVVKSDDQDWKLFVLSFCAFFTVAYTFIL
jgi:hypothetical protein